MNIIADKSQENNSQSVTNDVSQKQRGSETTIHFVDNRPKAIAQRKLQEMANNSSQVMELRAFQEMANDFAYTQGQDIYVGQMHGQVKSAVQAKGISINDDKGLEQETDVMAEKVFQIRPSVSVASEVPGLGHSFKMTGDGRRSEKGRHGNQFDPANVSYNFNSVDKDLYGANSPLSIVQRRLKGEKIKVKIMDVPEGNLEPEYIDQGLPQLYKNFNISIVMGPDEENQQDGGVGEYRQEVKGYFLDGEEETFEANEYLTLKKETYQEDVMDDGENYGHRDTAKKVGNQYTDLPTAGSVYMGEDHPRHMGNPEEIFGMFLSFRGSVVNTRTGEPIDGTVKEWTVHGTHKPVTE